MINQLITQLRFQTSSFTAVDGSSKRKVPKTRLVWAQRTIIIQKIKNLSAFPNHKTSPSNNYSDNSRRHRLVYDCTRKSVKN